MERVAQQMLDRHHGNDVAVRDESTDKVTARIERMTREATQIHAWLKAHPLDRKGSQDKPRKSNRTDNESAKLATDKGVIQGYCGVAVVDAAHQIIVEASAHGTGSEQELLLSAIDACAGQRNASTLITADAGYHSEANLAALAERGIDALIADNQMRRRDERFADQAKHTSKPDALYDKSGKRRKSSVFGTDDFVVAEDQSHAICPAGQKLHRNGGDCKIGSYVAVKFRAPESACSDCTMRTKCLRKPDKTKYRQVALLTRKTTATHTQTMRTRIDSALGRQQYGRRFATVEPVFGNIRHNKRLNRFTLRGRHKVDGQWKLFALVHNIEKWAKLRKVA